MNTPLFKVMLFGLAIFLLGFGQGTPSEVLAGDPLKLYYEENAQVELIGPEGVRVLIDVSNPGALSAPTARDVLLTTHNHGDHRRLDLHLYHGHGRTADSPFLLSPRISYPASLRIS